MGVVLPLLGILLAVRGRPAAERPPRQPQRERDTPRPRRDRTNIGPSQARPAQRRRARPRQDLADVERRAAARAAREAAAREAERRAAARAARDAAAREQAEAERRRRDQAEAERRRRDQAEAERRRRERAEAERRRRDQAEAERRRRDQAEAERRRRDQADQADQADDVTPGGVVIDIDGPTRVPPASSAPAGYDPDTARRMAPRVAAHIADRRYDYSRPLLREWQTDAGIEPDGIYGGVSAGALRYYHPMPAQVPRPLFRPRDVQSYTPPA